MSYFILRSEHLLLWDWETWWRDICVYSGDADKLNESEKQDESALEPANDSLAAGDITADSVKIHIT